MKSYIVLKDGNIYSGEFIGNPVNFLGEVNLAQDGALSIVCDATGNCITITSANTPYVSDATGNGVFTTSEYAEFAANFSDGKKCLGKLVVDTLPLEFHLYDVKTWLGYEQSLVS